MTSWLLNLLYEVTAKGKTTTLRDIFYEEKSIFKTPKVVAKNLADIYISFFKCDSTTKGYDNWKTSTKSD